MSLTGQGVLQTLEAHRAPNEKGQKRSQKRFFESEPLQVFASHTIFLTPFSGEKNLRICLFSISQCLEDLFHLTHKRDGSQGGGRKAQDFPLIKLQTFIHSSPECQVNSFVSIAPSGLPKINILLIYHPSESFF